jgi:integrase/recombinase XerD
MARENAFGFDLTDIEKRQSLPARYPPYWQVTAYGRAVGYQRYESGRSYWLVRIRLKNGNYSQHRLGPTEDDPEAGVFGMAFDDACKEAERWMATTPLRAMAADARPIGSIDFLLASPIGDIFTVGHALTDYVEWKRLVAAPSHFLTIVNLINHHLIPRLFPVPARQINGERFRHFVRDVLETPPKLGNQPQQPRRSIDQMTEEQLRKRKKTTNTLISILRNALLMAWENDRFESDRAWRCLRSIPNVDRPRILHLNRQECQRLLQCCAPDLQRLVLGALYTGCRVTELSRIRARDVDAERPTVYILPQKTRRERYVFLPDEGMEFFRSLVEGQPPDTLVFRRYNGRPWGSEYRYYFRLAVRASGLPQEFCFHCLRHTYASQLVQAGAPLIVVAEQLGHSNSDTVIRTYSHMAPSLRMTEVQSRFASLRDDHACSALDG